MVNSIGVLKTINFMTINFMTTNLVDYKIQQVIPAATGGGSDYNGGEGAKRFPLARFNFVHVKQKGKRGVGRKKLMDFSG
jgi:hypothetical protein